ncbi:MULTISPECIES: hypothetical protein [Nocardia]|uniref:hypothetical protein n=1 Tax=Nocardia TaxID=1817 RepID=UPI000BF14954|nr:MULTISPECIES: hypothetical protein [Nocardia]MBF6184156.1 hypothetical protein [Nocardia farcinica]MBF6290736.1 hypothetical protein [Nocardia farcinica]MBF6309999.1 hypothetical protein [Nocardia farcinica]MBF6377909.1 hypothetical protein [Nocardia farcinica]MBF6406179.1 hypothetical protein [Nocardia farcinica]
MNQPLAELKSIYRTSVTGRVKEAADTGVLKWVENWATSKDGQWSTGFSRLGIVGNVIGTVPAIANDINGGMDPTKAIVSEGAGTAAGMGLVSKSIQWIWS